MTQAPATPELVERLKDAAERFLKWTYDQPYSGSPVISIPRHPNNIDAILCEAADALEAQQARIAGLEGLIADVNALCTEINKRWEASQALADRYEKALREIARLRTELRGDFSMGSKQSDIARQALSSQGRHEGGEG